MELESKVYLKFLFPNLIIFLEQNKKDSLFRQIQKCFNEFQYQHLFKTEGTRYKNELGREISTCRIMQGVQVHVCLAEGEGILPGDAEQQAVERLLNKLCDSFYVIKANPQYFSKKCVPPMVLNADPSQRHVYKVVFLKKNSLGVSFPKPVSGAIDYVEDYNELFKYIDTQAQSDKKPDIFVLNILKADRPKIRKVCQRNKYSTRNLIGCSDMGVHAFVTLSTLMIQQSLLKDGGKNVKYKFIGPRDKYGDNEDKFDKHRDSKVATVQYEHLKQEGGEIVINQWIAEHLVLMDFFTESNELESVKEIIWRSVRDCPDTQEFIIEKTRSDGGVIYADAMIDRKVVGRARGYNIDQVKIEAARNAMDNLSKHCHYITAKRSYFGSSQELPNFLQDRIPIPQTKIYRVERKTDYPPNKILQQFKGSSLEDLYFLHDFSDGERQNIALLAKGMKFLVRWIGWKHILCVYKRRKPKEVLMELLSTKFKENEKYKLIIPKEKCETRLAPPSSATRMKQEVEGSIIKQEGSCRRLSVDAQADLESSDLRTSPSMSQPQASSQDHRVQHDDHKEVSSVQESEDLGQASNDIPEWVKKYIQTAPSKPTTHENPPKLENNLPETPKFKQTKVQKDVYSRYKFIPPKTIIPQQIHTSNFNKRGAYQRHTGQEQLLRASTAKHRRGGQKYRPLARYPKLGEPGGKDDPRRQGLSGAGTRRYLRLLEQGMEPDDAKKRVEERKAAGQNEPAPSQGKRGTQEITPPQREYDAKRRRVGTEGSPYAPARGQATTYAETTKLVKVAVLPKEYPKLRLGKEELSQLEDAIIREIARGTSCKVKFAGVHFRPGYMLVECINQETADWLRSKATQLQEWKGVELMACLGDDIPKAHNVTIFFPRSKGEDDKFILSLVESQNEGLGTQTWQVLRSKEEGQGKLLHIGIDDQAWEQIKKEEFQIFYRFGRIPVHARKPTEKEAGEKSGDSNQEETNQPGGAEGSDVQGNDLDLSSLNIATPKMAESMEGEEEQALLDGEEDALPQEKVGKGSPQL